MPVTTFTKVWEVIVTGVVLNQETINRFFYGSSDSLADAAGLGVTVETDLLPVIAGTMNQNASFLSLLVQGVKGATDFFSATLSIQGTNGGECLPPYASWDYTLVRGGARERNGYKRIAGVGEGNQQNGVASSGIQTALDLAANAMGDILTDGDGAVYTPVIRRTRVNKTPVNPAQYWSMTGAIYSKIGTQNSRKFGHGR